jgi:hypothetical protein
MLDTQDAAGIDAPDHRRDLPHPCLAAGTGQLRCDRSGVGRFLARG